MPRPSRNTITFTLRDTQERSWTIIAESCSTMGFRWTIYTHDADTLKGTLEAISPGGVANGWTDDELNHVNAHRFLLGLMQIKRAVLHPDCDYRIDHRVD